jgi:hypothetical protein
MPEEMLRKMIVALMEYACSQDGLIEWDHSWDATIEITGNDSFGDWYMPGTFYQHSGTWTIGDGYIHITENDDD